MTAYGFVGTGEITAAIVEGLQTQVTDPETQPTDPAAIFLSPRGREVGLDLSRRFPAVTVCASNQEVLDRAAVVVLAVPSTTTESVLRDLTFQPHHVLVSAVAGIRLDALRDLAAPAGEVVRTIPLPQATRQQSLTAMFPDSVAGRELLDRVGGVVVAGDESGLDAFTGATAMFSAHLDYLSTIVEWLVDEGVDSAVATSYVTHIFGQLGQSLLEGPDSLTRLATRHTTPGGLNQQVRDDLRAAGVPDTVRRAMDRVLTRVEG